MGYKESIYFCSTVPTALPCHGLRQPTVKCKAHPTEVISSDTKYLSFAKETAWRQPPGSAASQIAVEKAKPGTADTENVSSVMTGLKLTAWLTLIPLSPQSLHLCCAPQLPFLSSFPIVSHNSPTFPVFFNPLIIFLCQKERIKMSFIITTLTALPLSLPILSVYILSCQGREIASHPTISRVFSKLADLHWSLINNTINQWNLCKKKNTETSSTGLLTVMR